MGDSSVACGITGLSTMGRKALFVPLIKGEYSSVYGSRIVSNDGPRGRFVPITLPIFGTVDDYCNLEDIKKDANTKAIAQWYSAPIEEFVEKYSTGDNSSNSKYFGMFILQKAWNALSKKSLCGTYLNALDAELLETSLVLAGFVKDGQDLERERYNIKFVHPKIDKFIVWFDGQRWVELEYDGKKTKQSAYTLRELISVIEICGCAFPQETIDFLHDKHPYYPDLLHAKNKLREINERFEDSAGNQDFRRLMKLTNQDQFIFRLGHKYADPSMFDLIYENTVLHGDFDDLFMGRAMLEHNMYLINRPWGPTWHGCQYADKKAMKKYIKLVGNLINGD